MQPTRRPPFTKRPLFAGPLLILAAALAAGACTPGAPDGDRGAGGADPAEGSAGAPVTNEELQITLSRVPDGFRLARNEGAELVLERTDPEDTATLEVLVGPAQSAGVNLKERVWEEKARIESLPGGDYKGQNELAGAAIGTVFTSRGRFLDDDGEAVEEYRALAVHPVAGEDEHRLLILDYEYPPSERTGERLQQLMRVIGEIRAASGGADN
ncbi:MAG: hypothetical protein PVG07_12870 [Acidobacteriota bacterium]|jgi:hypothetical protein